MDTVHSHIYYRYIYGIVHTSKQTNASTNDKWECIHKYLRFRNLKINKQNYDK